MITDPNSPTTRDEALLRRIRGEFLEMPGLRLTSPQAQRLWALDAATCAAALEALVEAEFLIRLADGRYMRISDGPAVRTPGPMAKASLTPRASDRPKAHLQRR
jgi:hypothetical protein